MECCSCRLALTEVNFAKDRRNAHWNALPAPMDIKM